MGGPEGSRSPAWLSVLLAVPFLGITFVADRYGVVVIDEPVTRMVMSQVARRGRQRRRLDGLRSPRAAADRSWASRTRVVVNVPYRRLGRNR